MDCRDRAELDLDIHHGCTRAHLYHHDERPDPPRDVLSRLWRGSTGVVLYPDSSPNPEEHVIHLCFL